MLRGSRMKVRKHMSAPPITIADDTDFKSALGLMQKHQIRRLPVVNAAGVLTGIVAERDLLAAADRYLNSPVDVARIMTRQVVTVGDATPVVDAAILMIDRKIGGLPVVDPSRRPLGVITVSDLLKALTTMLQQRVISVQATKRPRISARPKKTAVRKKSATKRPIATASKAKPKSAKSNGDRKRAPATRKGVKRARMR
jgi:CBS domain-containing protein